MKLGMLMMPLHRPERPFLTVLREDQEAIVLADGLGFAEVYVGEHYSNKPEQITSPFIFLATLIERTRQIKFGTGVINLPQQHPAIVAAHAAMFDQLTEGRFIFGIGPGGSPGDFEMFKLNNPPDRPKMMQESIETILKIWSQEPPYEFPGGYWDFRIKDAYRSDLGVGVMARPYQTPHPPIAVSIMSPRSGSARTAGAHGWIPISANFTAGLPRQDPLGGLCRRLRRGGARSRSRDLARGPQHPRDRERRRGRGLPGGPRQHARLLLQLSAHRAAGRRLRRPAQGRPRHVGRGDHHPVHAGCDGGGRQPQDRDR